MSGFQWEKRQTKKSFVTKVCYDEVFTIFHCSLERETNETWQFSFEKTFQTSVEFVRCSRKTYRETQARWLHSGNESKEFVARAKETKRDVSFFGWKNLEKRLVNSLLFYPKIKKRYSWKTSQSFVSFDSKLMKQRLRSFQWEKVKKQDKVSFQSTNRRRSVEKQCRKSSKFCVTRAERVKVISENFPVNICLRDRPKSMKQRLTILRCRKNLLKTRLVRAKAEKSSEKNSDVSWTSVSDKSNR